MSFSKKIFFPDGKKFAFSIFDDTDYTTVENVKPIYDLLYDLKIFTTKSTWPLKNQDPTNPYIGSETLADEHYLKFIKDLLQKGFEIGYHNASMDHSLRERSIAGIEKFNELLGFYPVIHTNHWNCKENIYWGSNRFNNFFFKFIASRKWKSELFGGEIENSPYFWGDIFKKYIKYVRNFTFDEINLLNINPTLPYRDNNKKYSNFWFSSSDGGNVKSFNSLLKTENQIKLEKEGGVCIVYTHFGNGFVKNGKLNEESKRLLIELSKRDGWFVPVSTLLDYLKSKQKKETRSYFEIFKMEYTWLMHKVLKKI